MYTFSGGPELLARLAYSQWLEYLPGATLSIHARTLSVALLLVVAEPTAGRFLVLLERLKNLWMHVAIGHIH